jgi:flagellar protein FliS
MNADLASRAFAAYGRASTTIPPLEQIVMLYDGATLRVREARAAIERGDIEARFVATSKATAILDALQACLDHERGGEIAALLDRCYTYLSLRLSAVNIRNDPAICDEILARLGELRASWAELAAGAAAGTAPAREAAPGAAIA